MRSAPVDVTRFAVLRPARPERRIMADIFELFRRIGSGGEEKKKPVGWILAGLGNPGMEYRGTRHNAGFCALDYIAEKLSARVDRVRWHALCGEAELGKEQVLLMKPETFMNASGEAVGEAAAFYKIPPERVMILHDDISFAPGRVRMRRAGSAGGHNGLKSIIAHLGSENFPRVKIGVGEKPNREYPLADWVLGRLSEEDRRVIEARYPDIFDAVALWIGGDPERAMSRLSQGS